MAAMLSLMTLPPVLMPSGSVPGCGSADFDNHGPVRLRQFYGWLQFVTICAPIPDKTALKVTA
jgi:hypothetical protein